MRRSLESIYLGAASIDPHGPVHQSTREWWRNLIDRGHAQHLLARDLNLDQMVSWLTLSHGMLMMKIDAEPIDDKELRYFVRRFVVEPLLSAAPHRREEGDRALIV